MIKISIENGMASVFTPYNKEFVDLVKGIGGRKWNADRKCWMVPESEIEQVRKYMMDVFGETDQMDEDERVTVTITFTDDAKADCAGVTIFGKTIAKAWGRDSGARVGEDVTFISGNYGSGGSRANWNTYIEAGSKFRVRNVPKAMLANAPAYVTVEVVDDAKIDRSALVQEKEKLLARLAEIEKLLAE